jgi:hypothetical protein
MASPFDRARLLAASGLSRLARAASRASGVVASAPFGPMPDGSRPNIPPPAWATDQPPPPASPARFQRGYHDYTFRAYNPIRSIGGWDKRRADNAIELHDQGIFLESSTLLRAAKRYAPVATAFMLRRAPVLFLDRRIRRGARGFARTVGQEIEDQLADRGHGEQPSPTWPTSLWGSIEDDLAGMGFGIVQHAYGPQQKDGTRPCYSRLWPTESVRAYPYRRAIVAQTYDGDVDIIDGDGKWSIFAKSTMPWFDGAIRAVSSEYLSGGFARASMDNYVDEYGDPKWIGIAGEGMGPNTPEGVQFSEALAGMHEPGAWMEMPYGTKADVVQLDAKTSSCFVDVDRIALRNILIAILGSEGGIEKNQGVYTPESIMGVRYDIAADDIAAIVRAINFGRIRPSIEINSAATVEREREAGRWVDPVIEIELPDAELDARTDAIAKRMLKRAEIAEANEEAGAIMDQDEWDRVSTALVLEPIRLASRRPGGKIDEYHIVNKIVAPDQVLEDLGLPPFPGGIGSPERLAEERAEGKDKTGAKVAQEVAPGGPAAQPEPESAPAAPAPMPAAAMVDGVGVEWRSIGRSRGPSMRVRTKAKGAGT